MRRWGGRSCFTATYAVGRPLRSSTGVMLTCSSNNSPFFRRFTITPLHELPLVSVDHICS